MGLIKQHLDRESSKVNPDAYIVSELTKIYSRKTLEIREWRESGRFINRDDFMVERPEENLHVDCTDVLKYFGDIYLQLLKNGEFYLDAGFQSPDIKTSEQELWKKYVEELW